MKLRCLTNQSNNIIRPFRLSYNYVSFRIPIVISITHHNICWLRRQLHCPVNIGLTVELVAFKL